MKKELLVTYCKGLCMGVADIIPGISGGTIALILGIYDRLIKGVSNINVKFIPHILRGEYKKALNHINDMDLKLFIPLISGIITSFLIMSHIINYLLEHYCALMYSFFFGLILASSIVLLGEIKKLKFIEIPLLFFGFIISYLVVGSEYINLGHSLPILVLSGALAICAMILPGISGAFILLSINQYDYIIGAIKNFQIIDILFFGLGGIIGLLSFSKLLYYLLKNHRSATMFLLTGLMLGALRLPYIKIVENMNGIPFLYMILCGIFGFLAVILLEDSIVTKFINNIKNS